MKTAGMLGSGGGHDNGVAAGDDDDGFSLALRQDTVVAVTFCTCLLRCSDLRAVLVAHAPHASRYAPRYPPCCGACGPRAPLCASNFARICAPGGSGSEGSAVSTPKLPKPPPARGCRRRAPYRRRLLQQGRQKTNVRGGAPSPKSESTNIKPTLPMLLSTPLLIPMAWWP